MHENDEASELTRRRFIQFSSMAGATILTGASILAGAGHALSAPSPTCGPDPDENDCGNPHSKEPLWTKSQDCFKKGTCLQNHPDFVVMKGNPSKKKYVNYLLIPTKRINGIECPWICCSAAPNYWSAADYCATQQPTEVPAPVGLGINSRPARQLDQLHIHMARARPESYNDLVAQDKLAARTVENWADTRVSITGYSEQHHTNIQHTYRVLIWGGIHPRQSLRHAQEHAGPHAARRDHRQGSGDHVPPDADRDTSALRRLLHRQQREEPGETGDVQGGWKRHLRPPASHASVTPSPFAWQRPN
ncbi:CDP-diacylglycerol diphosphatase [Microbispora hainanensis]|uniref:CDP-diacylglycerol diphosphatase n=1 Tax=Microbispora hainanensis TaxID=568844 RepID=A0ABZ1SRB9_9ACTN|nr:CDP-diacylglycerol diphosphatase [Microbispora hainanensis]